MNTQEILQILKGKYPKKDFYLQPFEDLAMDGAYTDEEIKAMNLPEGFITFESGGIGIWDPYSSECSRFKINPKEEYGITKEDAELIVKHNKLTIHPHP